MVSRSRGMMGRTILTVENGVAGWLLVGGDDVGKQGCLRPVRYKGT